MILLALPKSTEFNKKIPKQKFYENINISPSVKKSFTEQIKSIYWTNKISTSTLSLSEGTEVVEIEVFKVKLNSKSIDEGILKQIDKEIHYHILYILEYENIFQAWIGYKEATSGGNNAFKVNGYYHTEWMKEEDLSLKIEGLSLDDVYENFIRQISGERLKNTKGKSLKEAINLDERKKKLQKRISALQTKIRNEKQFNKQMKLNAECKKLKEELGECE